MKIHIKAINFIVMNILPGSKIERAKDCNGNMLSYLTLIEYNKYVIFYFYPTKLDYGLNNSLLIEEIVNAVKYVE